MGHITRRQKDSKRRVLKLSAKRKNRRLARLRSQIKNEKAVDIMSSQNLNNDATQIVSIPLESSSNVINSATSTVTYERKIEKLEHQGRRIFDIKHLFNQILNSQRHEPFDCDITDMICIDEIRNGLKSTFALQCKMCRIFQYISTEDTQNDPTNIGINSAITLSAVSTGIGYSQLNEIAAAINMPMMSDKTYIHYHQKIAEVIRRSAWLAMEEAAKDEARLAIEYREIDKDEIPYITVVTDGAWSKRSYNINYDALSGVGCIIGHRTGKLLFLGIRNKYCTVCARSETKKVEVPTHVCYKNWNKASTGMETDIIVEGFKTSIELYGLKYLRMVGDGDSSVYRKLLQTKPYGNTLVEKVECRNHLLRNFSSKLREISNRKRSSSKNLPVAPHLRKELSSKSHRLRRAITKATRYRIDENREHAEKMQLLTNDILNAPSHIFGEHARCKEIAYFKCIKKTNETNLVPVMLECGLYQDIQGCLHRLVMNVNSLLLNMDNNLAEHYNGVVCKFVGGKRINFSLKGSYQTRCEAAALSFNTKEDYYSVLHKAFTNSSPKLFTKRFIDNIKRRRELLKKRNWLKKKDKVRRKTTALPDLDYGPQANQPLLTEEEYKIKKLEFMEHLKKTKEEILKIERDTRGQSGNPKWIQERCTRITASNFGRICKLRPKTSCVNTVKALLYDTFRENKATRYGTENELFAIKNFQENYHLEVQQCGLFVDDEYPFLGASPDGIIGNDAIVEIKCPEVLAELAPEEGIRKKKINFAVIENGKLRLKENHNYFYQVQGELAITKRSKCYFCIWSPLGLLVEEINRNRDFWKNKILPKLISFYDKCLLPELVDPCYPKGLEIRNPDHDEYPFLGASPDGIIGNDVIVEIKCPEVLAELAPEEGIRKKKINFAVIENGKLRLKENHNYFYQVQGELAITKRSKCYFCIWSPLGLLVEEINRNQDFWKNKILPKLISFYDKCLLPELVDPCYPKGLEIRNPDRK